MAAGHSSVSYQSLPHDLFIDDQMEDRLDDLRYHPSDGSRLYDFVPAYFTDHSKHSIHPAISTYKNLNIESLK